MIPHLQVLTQRKQRKQRKAWISQAVLCFLCFLCVPSLFADSVLHPVRQASDCASGECTCAPTYFYVYLIRYTSILKNASMEIATAVEYLKLLANETRLKLLGILADRERSVGELAEIVELKEPTISHHLTKLHAAGLVQMRADGNTHFYRLAAETLQQLSRELFTPERMVAIGGRDQADAWDRKVLGTFVDGERLTKIPDIRKKREVILRWLVERFEPGRRYPEPELNEIIKRHHPDTATLRRELVGAQLMQRENGIYWRLPAAAA
jgi:hypothetical protein